MRRQQVEDRLPRLPPVPHAVQQHQRRPGAVPFVSQFHRVHSMITKENLPMCTIFLRDMAGAAGVRGRELVRLEGAK
jgi:hypothetical protein